MGKERIARFEREALAAHFGGKLALHRVEPFVLAVVQMAGRATRVWQY